MQIQFVSKGIDVSQALRTHVETRVSDATSKYFSRPAEAFVTATREGHGFKAEIAVHLPSGAFLQATGEGGDGHTAVDDAATHLEKRLRRYKRKLKDHHAENKAELPAETGSIVVFKAPASEQDSEDTDANDAPDPIIIAEQVAELPTMSVSMAVQAMDAANASFLMFKNAASSAFNVVYRRPDGHVGWIDPSRGVKGGSKTAAE